MTKIIKVHKCARCPHLILRWFNGNVLCALDRQEPIKNIEIIQSWCPLEDAD